MSTQSKPLAPSVRSLIKSALSTAILLAISAGPAVADGGKAQHNHVYVKNCMGQRILVCSYNGNDGDMIAEHDFKRLKKRNTTNLDCHGRSKGGCKLSVARNAGGTCGLHGRRFREKFSNVYLEIHGTSGWALREVTEEEYKDRKCVK